MGKILTWRGTLEVLTSEDVLSQRQLVLRQKRVVVPFEEFAGYRWKKMKYGTVVGNVAGRRHLKPVGGNQ